MAQVGHAFSRLAVSKARLLELFRNTQNVERDLTKELTPRLYSRVPEGLLEGVRLNLSPECVERLERLEDEPTTILMLGDSPAAIFCSTNLFARRPLLPSCTNSADIPDVVATSEPVPDVVATVVKRARRHSLLMKHSTDEMLALTTDTGFVIADTMPQKGSLRVPESLLYAGEEDPLARLELTLPLLLHSAEVFIPDSDTDFVDAVAELANVHLFVVVVSLVLDEQLSPALTSQLRRLKETYPHVPVYFRCFTHAELSTAQQYAYQMPHPRQNRRHHRHAAPATSSALLTIQKQIAQLGFVCKDLVEVDAGAEHHSYVERLFWILHLKLNIQP